MIGEEGPPANNGVVTLSMTDLNPNFVCVLCFGYFVDATTISECLHTFCKSCIVNFLSTNHHCPHCDAVLSRTRPLSSLRPDRVMQSLVYKTVPGLFQTEMRRRIHFYQANPHPDFVADLEGVQNYVFNPDDSISLSIQYYNFRNEESSADSLGSFKSSQISSFSQDFKASHSSTIGEEDTGIPDIHTIRYFRCPATVPVSVLKSLIKTKYQIPEFLRVELLYGEECLLDSWTLMEVAYIFQWNRESPMELTFQVLITRKVKRKRFKLVRKIRKPTKSADIKLVPSEGESGIGGEPTPFDEPPQKKTKVEVTPGLYSSDQHHPHPLTPPETPDEAQESCYDTEISPNSKSLSMKIKREVCFSPQRNSTGKSSDSYDSSIFKQSKRSSKGPSPEKSTKSYVDISANYLEVNSMSLGKDCVDYATELNEEESEDYEGDQDSEAPLEVDMNNEMELEPESEADVSVEGDNCKDPCTINDFYDEEQHDSAIDVNELSSSEVMDSDDKDTDFNVSSESLDIENGIKSDLLSNEEKSENVERLNVDGSNTGALDLSSHAYTVRAKRVTSDSSTTPSPSPPTVENEKSSASKSSSTTTLNANSINMSEKLKELLPIGQNILSRGGISPRPTLPLDWVRQPLIGPPGVPHAAAFRDLVTLSHAAVQLQIAMAHAQAQAQAQAQVHAQAQKIQSEVQKNALKNLKSNDSLSFVNGSGDTLTISPIVSSQGDTKPKVTKSSKSKIYTPYVNGQLKKSQVASHKNVKTTKSESSSLKNKIQTNGMVQNKNFLSSKVNIKNSSEKTESKSVLHTNKSNINKMHSSSTLKIPCVQVSSKQNGHAKFDKQKDKKEHIKDKERTGDPVFKITNQKLIEFVRQQHLNNKLKQNNNSSNNNNNNNIKLNDNINSESSGVKSSSTGHLSNNNSLNDVIGKQSIKPTAPVTSNQTNLTKKIDMINFSKESAISGNRIKPLTNNTSLKPPSASTSKPPSLPPTITSSNTNSVTSLNSSTKTLTASANTNPSKNLETTQASKSVNTFTAKSLIGISTTPSSSIRTTNTNVRQIPNPSRLHQQSENRLSVGMGRLGVLPKKGLISGSKTEGLSRIESLTRSLHEKVAASAAIAANSGVLNTAAR